MSVKATIDGEVWEFSTAAEAAEFKRSLRGDPPVTPQPPAPPVAPRSGHRGTKRKTRAASKPAPVSVVSSTPVQNTSVNGENTGDNGGLLSDNSMQILRTALQIPAGGIQSDEFAQRIGIASKADIPLRMMVMGKELKALGVKPEEVLERTRIYVKGRGRSVYRPGKRLQEVLSRQSALQTNG